VHVTYQSAFVDQAGQLNLREDIYELDAAVLKLMRGSERLIADTPIPPRLRQQQQTGVARFRGRPRTTAKIQAGLPAGIRLE
jgi:hypothetical protein